MSSELHPTEDPEHHGRLVTRLAEYGLELRPKDWMTVKGNCMFDALADQICIVNGRLLSQSEWFECRSPYSNRMRERIGTWLASHGNISVPDVSISIDDARNMLSDPSHRPSRATSPALSNGKLSDFYVPTQYHSSWAEYCDRLADATAIPREEGDHIALIGASNSLQRNIIVVSSAPGENHNHYITTFSPFESEAQTVADGQSPLYLVHWFPVHYDSAIRCNPEAKRRYSCMIG